MKLTGIYEITDSHLTPGEALLTAVEQTLEGGITRHTDLKSASWAEHSGASHVTFGRFFRSRTKPAATPAEFNMPTRARERPAIPMVAIGGIGASNKASAVAAGADMLAVINYLFSARDMASRARELNAI